jgi:hypothetical protein
MILDPDQCPFDVMRSLELYRDRGVPVGDFLEAVLSNNLAQAFGHADEQNCEALGHIVAWVWNNLPTNIWGSREAYIAQLTRMQNLREEAQV